MVILVSIIRRRTEADNMLGGCVKDVTRRYAKNFNAKTRKLRLDSTKGGELWWLEVMKLYERSWDLVCRSLETKRILTPYLRTETNLKKLS